MNKQQVQSMKGSTNKEMKVIATDHTYNIINPHDSRVDSDYHVVVTWCCGRHVFLVPFFNICHNSGHIFVLSITWKVDTTIHTITTATLLISHRALERVGFSTFHVMFRFTSMTLYLLSISLFVFAITEKWLRRHLINGLNKFLHRQYWLEHPIQYIVISIIICWLS